MKVNDVIRTIDEKDIMNRIMGKLQQYPANSISPRDVAQTYNLGFVSREEAEEIVSQLDKTITSALLSFKPKLKK